MTERQPERIPVPDPTVLTTQALQREVNGIEKLFDQRINGIEQAVKVAHENLVRVPTDVQKAIGHLREVMDEKIATVGEKFSSVQTQFRERDARVEQTARDSKVAIDAALSAQVKSGEQTNASFASSIAKSEAATNKQIDQLGELIRSTAAGSATQIADLKERMNRWEGIAQGQTQAVGERRDSGSAITNWGGLIAGAVLAIAAILSFFFTHVSTH